MYIYIYLMRHGQVCPHFYWEKISFYVVVVANFYGTSQRIVATQINGVCIASFLKSSIYGWCKSGVLQTLEGKLEPGISGISPFYNERRCCFGLPIGSTYRILFLIKIYFLGLLFKFLFV